MIKRYWWLLLLLVFDFTYFYFIKHITTPKTDSLWVPINWDGLFFVFLISLFSLACVRWVKSRLDRLVTLSIPLKYLQILLYSFVLFVFLWAGTQLAVEYAAENQRNLEYVISNVLVFSFLHVIVGNAYVAVEYFRESNQLKQDLLRTEKARIESELRGLHQQMSPHFLFNNLNTLASLIPQDTEKAVAFTQGLSQVFRYLSQNGQQDVIALSAELKFIDRYMKLLQVRFGSAYVLEVRLDEVAAERILVVPLSLQTIVENVVKHNSGSRSEPLSISIFIEGDDLVIRNELRRKIRSDAPESGLGLANLAERYQLLFGKDIHAATKDGYFTVRLPIVKNIEDEGPDH